MTGFLWRLTAAFGLLAGVFTALDDRIKAAAVKMVEGYRARQATTRSLGHNVGLEVHEWPRIASTSQDRLPEGAVVTIEPGIYLPKQFGIRIEDMVVLRENGCENLTASPRELQVVG